MARWRKTTNQLAKAQQTTKPPRLSVNTQKQPRAYAAPGGFVRVQRPDQHAEPILARLVAVGEHGITATTERGHRLRVRHAHVVEPNALPSGRERAQFAASLADAGVPVPLDEQYLHLNAEGKALRRATQSQIALMQALTGHGVPYNLEAITAASYDDAEALIGQYVTDPAGKIGGSLRERNDAV